MRRQSQLGLLAHLQRDVPEREHPPARMTVGPLRHRAPLQYRAIGQMQHIACLVHGVPREHAQALAVGRRVLYQRLHMCGDRCVIALNQQALGQLPYPCPGVVERTNAALQVTAEHSIDCCVQGGAQLRNLPQQYTFRRFLARTIAHRHEQQILRPFATQRRDTAIHRNQLIATDTLNAGARRDPEREILRTLAPENLVFRRTREFQHQSAYHGLGLAPHQSACSCIGMDDAQRRAMHQPCRQVQGIRHGPPADLVKLRSHATPSCAASAGCTRSKK